MTDFWMGAALLVLCALAFLLLPIWRVRAATSDVDRTALNVSLYQERVAELTAQRDSGALTAEQFEQGCAEASRELLDDADARQAKTQRLGRGIPLLFAVALPLLGLGLYAYWGALEQVELAREFETPPASLEQMIDRLERTTAAQPELAEPWYFLGRAYLSAERPAQAAEAFGQAVALAGREPELLGQWAQARYFANNKQWDESLQALADEVLAADPNEVTTLGLLGIAAFEREHYAEAISYWQRLVAALPETDPTRAAIQSGIEAARQRGALAAEVLPESPVAAESNTGLRIRVELAAELKDKVAPEDTVFVSARAVDGPPMPLAVQRFTVAQLPVELVLSDKDAMLPQLTLSSVPQVILQARVSRNGDARQGEWVGRSEPIASTATSQQQLLIDQADVR